MRLRTKPYSFSSPPCERTLRAFCGTGLVWNTVWATTLAVALSAISSVTAVYGEDAAAAAPSKSKPSPQVVASGDTTPDLSEQEVLKRLQEKVAVDFSELPLSGVIDAFKDATKLPIYLDIRALEEAGIAIDTPITFSSKNLSAQSTLNLILYNLDLTWVVKNGVVLITTTERAESPDNLVTKVYPVQDLVAPRPSYRFEGTYLPGLSQGGFPRTLAAGRPSQNHNGGLCIGAAGDPAFGSAGGMMGRANSGGMGGGMGGPNGAGGMGGGFFNVDAENAASSTPAATQPATPPATQPATPPATQPIAPKPSRGHGGGVGAQGQANDGAMPLSQVSPENTLVFTMDDLINTITSSVTPDKWDCVGGPGSITPLASMLVIRQTLNVHLQVEKLLEELRAASPGSKTVTIQATWLLLTLEQRNQLQESNASKNGVDRKALETMASQTPGYLGEISCFCGQTVHMASGRIRSAVVSAIPVVGGEDPGYQPIIAYPQSGAVLQVTPQLLPDRKNAIVDLSSVVTFSESPDETIRFLGSDATGRALQSKDNASAGHDPIHLTLDRVKMLAGQLGTTIKMPLGEPVLVGGLSRAVLPGEETQPAASQPQMYLFIEATVK